MFRVFVVSVGLWLAVFGQCSWLGANENNSDQSAFFENRVRPILANHCFECHGSDRQESGLRLDSLASALQGGEIYGAAIKPKDPDDSPLVDAIQYGELEMPPDRKLGKHEVATLVEWVRKGAFWPGEVASGASVRRQDTFRVTAEDRDWWSFRPIESPTVPVVEPLQLSRAHGDENPIDAFIRMRLQSEGLSLSPPATRRQLIRRLYFGLVGLPPSPDLVDAFVASDSPADYEDLVDDLLASPQFGVRWARHWLDVARYGQTNGYERDGDKPESWRYRDYVVNAFNNDKPFDVFVREQIAGDEIADVTDESITATGFCRLGVWDDEPDDKRQAEFDGLDDIVSTTGSAFLGLTIGCARCHDHKFDPLAQKDYYRLLAFFRNVRYYDNKDSVLSSISDGQKTLAITEHGTTAPETHLLIRGSAGSPGDVVQPGFPYVLVPSNEGNGDNRIDFPTPANAKSTGRRLALANWVTSPNNPLTARVIVNRLWHYHFGRGLVDTPNDFGRTGSQPSHPALLDWLASRLIDEQWRLKPIHKLIVMSATYRQSSNASDERVASAAKTDPDNRLLWRQNLRRLDAEVLRDAVLSVHDGLNTQLGGPSFYPDLPPDIIAGQSRPGLGWKRSAPAEKQRRSLFAFVKRGMRVPLLETFDAASPDRSIASRPATVVATQALTLLNSPLLNQQSAYFADWLLEQSQDASQQITLAYRAALGRKPTAEESRIALDYLGRQTERFASQPNELTFSPGLPSAVEVNFLKNTPSNVLLASPPDHWTLVRGDWPDRGDSINWLNYDRGPAALWDSGHIDNGTIDVEFRLHRNAELGGLLFRSEAQGNLYRGLELHLDVVQGRLSLRRVSDNVEKLAERAVPLETDRKYVVRIKLDGDDLQVFWNDADTPMFEVKDSVFTNKLGAVGFRCWGAPLSVTKLEVRSGDKVTSADKEQSRLAVPPDLRALRAFCNLVYNLNEFIYID